MTYPRVALMSLAFGLCAYLAAAERAGSSVDDEAGQAAFMRAKLASSQKIVEGLVSKDFGLIQKGSEELLAICQAQQWPTENDSVYEHYRVDLQRTTKKLSQLAREKNLDGAAYTYMHSLTTCISCHSYCRDVLHVAATPPELQAVPPAEEDDRINDTSAR